LTQSEEIILLKICFKYSYLPYYTYFELFPMWPDSCAHSVPLNRICQLMKHTLRVNRSF